MEMMMITGQQMRGARAMLGWEQAELAEKAGVSVKTIKRMEGSTGQIDARSIWSVKKALELGGIEFLDGDGDWRSRGEGIRFSKDPTGKLRRDLVEKAGGWLETVLMLKTRDDPDFFERPLAEVVDFVMKELKVGVKKGVEELLHKPA